jgi:hypothetical protein
MLVDVQVLHPDHVTQVEGRVRVHEVGGGGRAEVTISVGQVKLWSKADNNLVCPSSLPFSVTLPTKFQEDGRSYVGGSHS